MNPLHPAVSEYGGKAADPFVADRGDDMLFWDKEPANWPNPLCRVGESAGRVRPFTFKDKEQPTPAGPVRQVTKTVTANHAAGKLKIQDFALSTNVKDTTSPGSASNTTHLRSPGSIHEDSKLQDSDDAVLGTIANDTTSPDPAPRTTWLNSPSTMQRDINKKSGVSTSRRRSALKKLKATFIDFGRIGKSANSKDVESYAPSPISHDCSKYPFMDHSACPASKEGETARKAKDQEPSQRILEISQVARLLYHQLATIAEETGVLVKAMKPSELNGPVYINDSDLLSESIGVGDCLEAATAIWEQYQGPGHSFGEGELMALLERGILP